MSKTTDVCDWLKDHPGGWRVKDIRKRFYLDTDIVVSSSTILAALKRLEFEGAAVRFGHGRNSEWYIKESK